MNGMYEELIEKLRKNNRMSGWTHIDRLMDDAIKAIEALQRENEIREKQIEQRRAQATMMREALKKAKDVIFLEKGLINHLKHSSRLKSKKWERIVDEAIAEIEALGGKEDAGKK